MNPQRTDRLTKAIMEVIKSHYMDGPFDREKVFEALNALGIAAGLIVMGAEEHEEALSLLITTINEQMEIIRAYVAAAPPGAN